MNKNAPPITVMFPAFNAEKYITAAIRSFVDQTYTDFEMIISDNASEDNTEAICREFAASDKRIQYIRNPVNIGANGNYRNLLAHSRGKYLLLASDHDLWRPDILEHYLEVCKNNSETVLVYSPATVIAATGEVTSIDNCDRPKDVGRYSTFFNVFSGAISSNAINGLVRAEALLKTSTHTSLGPDTLLLAELSLYGNFHQLPESYYLRRQNRPPESIRESASRYISMLFDDPPVIIKKMPYAHMVYKSLCMVQNNGLLFQDQKILNEYILFVFINSWGVTYDNLADLLIYMKNNPQKSAKEYTAMLHEEHRRQKPEQMILDMDTFFKTINDGPYSEIVSKYNLRVNSSVKPKQSEKSVTKKWNSDKKYDVCYLLFDAGKWGGVMVALAQANGLVDRGYRVCIVCGTGKPDWTDIRADFVVSPNLSANDIPMSDIIIGTWYPTVSLGVASKKGVCVHLCQGYEAHDPSLSMEQKSAIERVYGLSTIKIANAAHVANFLKEHFPEEVYLVRNDFNHSIFYPRHKRVWGDGTIKVAVVGPYEVGWKGIRNSIEAYGMFSKMTGIKSSLIRVSQTPLSTEENQLLKDLGCSYEYRCNLSEREMAELYNECDMFVSGSYPFVESFGRPAMEALACGIPAVLTDIPAYLDYDEVHDYAVFVEPGNARAMAEAMHKVVNDNALRERLIKRGTEVSSKYSLEKTIDDLDRVLQEIHRRHNKGAAMSDVNHQYYGFSRPEVQALVDPKAKRILDIGCAAGRMGAELKDRLGAEVWGIEIVEEVAREAEKKLDKVIAGSVEAAIPQLPDRYFDAIILADVLEHLAEPQKTLKELKSKLFQNGEIIASIPNVRHWSVLKDLIEGRWDYQDAGILDRTHLRFFTRKSVMDLFSETGFRLMDMKATTIPGMSISKQLVDALSKAQLDTSTLAEESNHYQYLVKAAINRKAGKHTSIVILTFNQLNYTRECVESIRRHTPEPHEIIFVDNGSTDGTVKWLRQAAKDNSNYKIIENAGNLGFAKGCNQGMAAATGEYILLLNNDVVVTEGWLSGMIECLKSSDDIGIVGPMTNNISGPQKVPDVTYRSVAGLDEYAKAYRDKHRHRRVTMRRVVGFCMLFRSDLVDRIGYLDENFGSGNFEDDDLCLRASMEGYRNLIAGDVFIHHYGSVSFTGNRIDHSAAMSRNKNIYFEKWSGIDIRSDTGKKLITVKALDKADEARQQDDLKLAIDTYLEGMKFAKDDPRLYSELAALLLDAKRFQDAIDALTAMPERGRTPFWTALKGYCKEGLDSLDEAAMMADDALLADPESALAMNLKGIIAFKRGSSADASSFFSKAVELDAGYGDPYTNLGVLSWSAGEHEKGLLLLEKGFMLSPLSRDAADMYYSAISQTGQFSRAEAVLNDALGLYQSNKRLMFVLIDCLLRMERYGDAMDRTEDAIIMFGADEGILNAAAAIREKIGPKQIGRTNSGEQSVSLCMIVKNEERYLARCLKSAAPVVDEMIIVDTGSTDKTRDIAKAFGAKVFEFDWNNDFSEARNFSLSKAEGDWILVLDGDEVIATRDHAALKQLAVKKNRNKAYYIVTRNYVDVANVEGWQRNDGTYAGEEAGTGWVGSTKVRLFPNEDKIRFENPVHELVENSIRRLGKKIVDCTVQVHHYGKMNSDKTTSKGEAYYELGKKKMESQGGDQKAIFELALQAAELEKYDEALELWKRYLELDPGSAKAHFNMGYNYLKLGRFHEGIESSRKALSLERGLKEAILNYASCEVQGGSLENAVALLENMLIENPKHPSATALLGVAYFLSGEEKKGVECMEVIRRLGADSAEVIHNHARELERAQRPDYAKRLLNTAVSHGYVNANVLTLLGDLLKK